MQDRVQSYERDAVQLRNTVRQLKEDLAIAREERTTSRQMMQKLRLEVETVQVRESILIEQVIIFYPITCNAHFQRIFFFLFPMYLIISTFGSLTVCDLS